MERPKNTLFSILKLLIGWPLSLLALFFLFRISAVKGQEILGKLENLSLLPIACAFLCLFLYYLFRARSWQLILRSKGHHFSFKRSGYLWALAELRRFIPGSIWSFLSKTLLFAQEGISKKDIASAMLVEMQLFVIGSFVISLPAAPFVASAIFPDTSTANMLAFLYTITVCLGIGGYLFSEVLVTTILKNRWPFVRHLLPAIAPKRVLILLIHGTASMFFFALGTYFALSSLIFLHPKDVLLFMGIAVFAFLGGYFSIIAPMGIGIREGLLAWMLTKFIPLSVASIATIFVRILLIATELFFLFFLWAWNFWESPLLKQAEVFIKQYRYACLLVFMVVFYIVYFSTATIYRYDNYYAGRFDLGNMDQTVWNTSQGKIFQLTNPDGTEITTRLAIHADFILLLLAPFYFLWSDPRMLLIIQTVVVAAGAVFVYLIARKILQTHAAGIIFAGIYLLNPAVQFTNLYDFHAVTLATTFLLAAFYFFEKRQILPMVLFLLLAALCKEQIWALVVFFGVWLLVYEGWRYYHHKIPVHTSYAITGIVLTIIGVSMFYYLISIAIPGARGGDHFALSYYSDFGNTPAEVIKNILFSPDKFLLRVFGEKQLLFLYQLFAPLGFLSLAAPYVLVFAGPDLAINLLSTNTQLHEIYYQYTAVVTPFLFISAIYGIRNIRYVFPQVPLFFFLLLVLSTSLATAYQYGPLPGSKQPSVSMFAEKLSYKHVVDSELAKIPKQASVAATNNVGSHLSHRDKIFTLPLGRDQADYIVLLLTDQAAQPSPQAQREWVEELQADPRFQLIATHQELYIFQRVTSMQ